MDYLIYALGCVCTFYIIWFAIFAILVARAPLGPNDG
jgi:hypothetical protein